MVSANMKAAILLLILIYVFAFVFTLIENIQAGLFTGFLGLVAALFMLATQACLTSGNCYIIAWMYVLIYAIILLMLVACIGMLVHRNRESVTGHKITNKDETHDQKAPGSTSNTTYTPPPRTGSTLSDYSNDTKEFLQERKQRMMTMLKDHRARNA